MKGQIALRACEKVTAKKMGKAQNLSHNVHYVRLQKWWLV
jgi:hypothetical protein